MQYLILDEHETLQSLTDKYGSSNVNAILAENGLKRAADVTKAWKDKCETVVAQYPEGSEVSAESKSTLLNGIVGDDEIFEKACLQDEDEWKIFQQTHAFVDALKVPENISLPNSAKVIGSYNGRVMSTSAQSVGQPGQPVSTSTNAVSNTTYRAVMNSLKNTGTIDPSIFETVNTGPAVSVSSSANANSSGGVAFNLPWGKIIMYSTVLKEAMDFPVYPEQIETGRQATYVSMPDIIYQYEPWITFESSGPREQNLEFHMHRDMWTGNHLDGRANKLIRFCEANTFADYNGSAVITPLVRLYIDGELFISGVIKSTNVTWTGPIGQDNWYLEFTLSLGIQEISESALNCKSFYKRKLKEG